MDRIVRVLAPQTFWQMILLFFFAQVLIGAAAFAYDVGVHQVPVETYLANALGTFLVAFPFILLVLLMLQHQAALQDRLARLADTDALTGLLNRRAFLAKVARDGRARARGAVIVLDVDRFKPINDDHGHDAGDRCLVALAERLSWLVQATGQVARLGGDEFVVFQPDCDAGAANQLAEQIAQGAAVECQKARIEMTVAVGAVVVEKGALIADALRQADDNMYQAKRQGQAKVVCTAPHEAPDPMPKHAARIAG